MRKEMHDLNQQRHHETECEGMMRLKMELQKLRVGE